MQNFPVPFLQTIAECFRYLGVRKSMPSDRVSSMGGCFSTPEAERERYRSIGYEIEPRRATGSYQHGAFVYHHARRPPPEAPEVPTRGSNSNRSSPSNPGPAARHALVPASRGNTGLRYPSGYGAWGGGYTGGKNAPGHKDWYGNSGGYVYGGQGGQRSGGRASGGRRRDW